MSENETDRDRTTSVMIVGLGGHGVLTASGILAEVAHRCGYDVKQSEIHGMSQRGGSVSSEVRFGRRVRSPLVPAGKVDYLLAMDPDEFRRQRGQLRPGGASIVADEALRSAVPDRRCLNAALLGWLAERLPFPDETWRAVLAASVPPKTVEANQRAFDVGRARA